MPGYFRISLRDNYKIHRQGSPPTLQLTLRRLSKRSSLALGKSKFPHERVPTVKHWTIAVKAPDTAERQLKPCVPSGFFLDSVNQNGPMFVKQFLKRTRRHISKGFIRRSRVYQNASHFPRFCWVVPNQRVHFSYGPPIFLLLEDVMAPICCSYLLTAHFIAPIRGGRSTFVPRQLL
jgi:hypothetical protein